MQILLWIPVVVVLLFVSVIYTQNARVPSLGHDNGQLKPLSKDPNGVSTQTDDPSKRVEPWAFRGDRATTLKAVQYAVAQYGNAETKTVQDDYLYVVFVTPLMRYRDDAEFYLDESTQQVHFRSKSRAGKSDLGLNKKRFGQLTEYYHNADLSAL